MEKDSANAHTDSDSAGQETPEVHPIQEAQSLHQESPQDSITNGEKEPTVNVGPEQNEKESAKEDGTENKSGVLAFVIRILTWAPPRCRYDPDKPFKFNLALNLLFGLATTVTVANLYYVQPILFKIAETFDVSFERASTVATLLQAGYATGILLLCPLGDIFRRRPYILFLTLFTATLVRSNATQTFL